jgi:hypothetical protein
MDDSRYNQPGYGGFPPKPAPAPAPKDDAPPAQENK